MNMQVEELRPLAISILSGKGGVGKSSLALNLAYALHNLGNKILLVDGDIGLANLDIMLGITPEKTIEDIIRKNVSPKDLFINLEREFDFLPAASGIPEIVDWDFDLKRAIMEKLNDVLRDYKYTIFDLGAGIQESVIMFASMTPLRCIVITNEPTSLTDAYAVIKVLNIQRGVKHFFIIVNMVKSQKEGIVAFERLKKVCEKFLNLKINLLGVVEEDVAVANSIRTQTPFFKSSPYSKATKAITEIGKKLVYLHKKINSFVPDSPLLLEKGKIN